MIYRNIFDSFKLSFVFDYWQKHDNFLLWNIEVLPSFFFTFLRLQVFNTSCSLSVNTSKIEGHRYCMSWSSYQRYPLKNDDNWWRLQKQSPEVFYKKALLKKFTIFTDEHPCWSLFWIKIGVFLWILPSF